MSEELLIRHCSPTLAGMKTGNLFVCSFADRAGMRGCVRCWNRLLTKKGLRILPLRFRNGRALIYVYRPSRLSADLQNGTAKQLLQERGYCTDTSDRCVVQLIRRLCACEEFPPRDRSVSRLSPGGCLRLYRKQGGRLQMRRLLEGVR